MKPVIAVIGAGYGDEGKGLATDYFARRYTKDNCAPLVVRGNGGAQAGHTVIDGDRRHVFGHIGSGTFAGSYTHLASNFIVNPLAFMKEYAALNMRDVLLTASSDCRVTTIYDMVINSLVEISRGSARHGSCGLGINETVTRHAAGHFLTLGMLKKESTESLQARLNTMLHDWVIPRMVDLKIHNVDFGTEGEKYFSALRADEQTARALKNATHRIIIDDPKTFTDVHQEIIYEGAQGLALDEFLGQFPHVTRSVTGLPSAIRAAAECGRTEVQPVYITRCYKTRHGAGPLLHEGESFGGGEITDLTNVDNPWQGSIRYAPLDIPELIHFIYDDAKRSESVASAFGIKILTPKIAVTCLDQVGSTLKFYGTGKSWGLQSIDTADFTEHLAKALNIQPEFESWGPTAECVRAL